MTNKSFTEKEGGSTFIQSLGGSTITWSENGGVAGMFVFVTSRINVCVIYAAFLNLTDVSVGERCSVYEDFIEFCGEL